MFNIGPGELMAILGVALIVLGPTRLPEAVRTVGRVVGELRRISSGFQDELRNAFDDSDVIDQLEKGPSAGPATREDDVPIVDDTGTLAEDAVATVDGTGTLADSARVDAGGADRTPDTDTGGDEAHTDTDTGTHAQLDGADGHGDLDTDDDGDAVVDTSALGLRPSAPTERADGDEEISEDPPETDQRAAS